MVDEPPSLAVVSTRDECVERSTLLWHLPSLSAYFFIAGLAVAGLVSSPDPLPSDRQPHNCMMSEGQLNLSKREKKIFIHTYIYEDTPRHTGRAKVSVDLCVSFVRGRRSEYSMIFYHSIEERRRVASYLLHREKKKKNDGSS
jgi:hypothetical protein